MRFSFAFLAALLAALILVARGRAADVEQWGVWELSLDGPREGDPCLDVELCRVILSARRPFFPAC